jgi:alpha-tubulin suppressor-like RCC1 family protein
VKLDGTAVCWGSNAYGQVGDGTNEDRLTPQPVSGLTHADTIGTGSFHSCALKQDDTAVCWGANYNGQFGDGTNTSRLTPTPVFNV